MKRKDLKRGIVVMTPNGIGTVLGNGEGGFLKNETLVYLIKPVFDNISKRYEYAYWYTNRKLTQDFYIIIRCTVIPVQVIDLDTDNLFSKVKTKHGDILNAQKIYSRRECVRELKKTLESAESELERIKNEWGVQ